jgi:hypothetical protein
MTTLLLFNNNVNSLLINLIDKISIIISYVDSFILILSPNFYHNYILIIIETILFGAFILFAARIGKEVLDITAKLVTIAAGGIVIHDRVVGGGGSSSSDDNNDNKDKNDKKDAEKKDKTDDTNKNEPKSETTSKDSKLDSSKISNKISQSFSLFGVVLSQLNINVEDTASNLTHISYGIFLISLVALCCFINIMGFLITYILIQNSNYEIKYPKLIKFINYYKKSSLFYVTIEALLCLTCLLLLVVFSLLIVYSGIKN